MIIHDILLISSTYVCVDLIDIVKDAGVEQIKEEDPTIFVSRKTGRGPLNMDWLDCYKQVFNFSFFNMSSYNNSLFPVVALFPIERQQKFLYCPAK